MSHTLGPSFGGSGEPSIAAVVGSLDKHATRFAANVQVQGANVEVIQARPPCLPACLLPPPDLSFEL